ncbi:MAG: 16S rRNA (guanine(527)-N(7))-methyltransferase RsmG [Bacteroidales bacterium]|nr:16S rRNA (guanine(527)-N(7))-methyltransferase RsmG [Bacteroidales bacterium]
MDFAAFESLLREKFPESLLGGDVLDRFRRMAPLYEEWNSKINVISRKDIDDFYHRHVYHSLCIARWFLEQQTDLQGLRFLDVGTGGGFPGIPLAVLLPGCEFVLVDSIAKKIRVASEVASALAISNVRTVVSRVEDLPSNEKFDYVVSRAVTSLENFLPWVKGRWTEGILYLKGGSILPGGALEAEISRARGSKAFPSGGSVGLWPLEGFEEKYVLSIRKTSIEA